MKKKQQQVPWKQKVKAELEEKRPQHSNHARGWGFYKSILKVDGKIYYANGIQV